MKTPQLLKACLLLLAFTLTPDNLHLMAAPAKKSFAFIGTYTEGKNKGKGIYCFSFDTTTGTLSPISITEGIKNPSFLAIHPDGKHLYAVSELAKTDDQPGGSVWSYKIDLAKGTLYKLNHVPSGGEGPCFVAVDKTGHCALVANYDNGSIAALKIADDGSLCKSSSKFQHQGHSIDPARQMGPHAHSINVSPDNHFAVVADLGLDKLMVYKLDPRKAELTANEPAFCNTPPGGGPRHLSFSVDGKYAYVSNEMKSTLSVYAFDAASGSFKEIQTISTLAADHPGNSTAEVQVHPSGKFVYCSNRGDDSLAIFALEESGGKLKASGHQKVGGHTPRNFTIDPSGAFLVVCNQNSDNIVVFKIDPISGQLTQQGEPIKVPAPVCLKFSAPRN